MPYHISVYEPEDLDQMHSIVRDPVCEYDMPMLRMLAKNPLTWTIRHDNTVLCIGGVSMMWPRTYTIWSIVSEDMRGHGLAVTKMVKLALAAGMKDFCIDHLVAYVHEPTKENIRWLELLGFKHAGGIRESSLDGADVLVMQKSVH